MGLKLHVSVPKAPKILKKSGFLGPKMHILYEIGLTLIVLTPYLYLGGVDFTKTLSANFSSVFHLLGQFNGLRSNSDSFLMFRIDKHLNPI